MRRDLLAFDADAFIAWGRAAVGHADRFHRAAYRHLVATGRFAPQAVPEWREADAAAPGVLARYAALADEAQALPVVAQIVAGSAEHGPTTKLALRTDDGRRIESVLIPMAGGGHHTVCVSSQVGCRMGCGFCHTATMGLVRQLRPHEIVAQVAAVRAHTGIAPRNVVFMGMGEPLDNPEAVAAAVRVLSDVGGFAIGRRHITVSTVGRIDGLRRWRQLGLEGVNVAVSLTAADDGLRSELMPINRAMPLAELKAALAEVPLSRSGRILVAVVVIPGITDAPAQVDQLIAWCRGLPVLVNLIPFNPIPSRPWRAPDDAEVAAVRARLDAAGIPVRRRTTKGDQVMAACGQLGEDPDQAA